MNLKKIIKTIRLSVLVLFMCGALSGCLLWNTAQLAYGITSGTISGAYSIISTSISLAHSLYKAIDKWADKQVASQKVYVKYTSDYEDRAIIDYEKGTVVIETINEDDPYASLHDAIVSTLLTPDDPRMVDLFSSDDIEIGKTPFLLGQVVDNNDNPIATKAQANAYAKWLLENRARSYDVHFDGDHQPVFGVSLKLVIGHEYLRAQKFIPYVLEYSKEYGVSKSLIMAVMETESAFNPFAVSSSGALGLMQIMQASAGKEVYTYLHDREREPPEDTLFQPKFNIQYGTIYLHLLSTRHLGGIRNPLTREYCVTAAYNTGPGNLLRTFDDDKEDAIDEINSMSPEQVYNYLRRNLPYEETQRYIVKVREAKKKYN